ncbi:fusaric acid resistance protein [Frateuria sp. Soil773]|uniref:FUSC family protein n=1 Tax=Frateuria sp. Soil773 TaxID=1736407 RepID=UPI0006FCB57D|nr:FUSC family protein [Frateuria sp. Soil773]KRF02066.1 fusaric acid resistance protein [Frateuria sp. Soil773]
MSAVPALDAAAPRKPWLADFLAGERRAWLFVLKSVLAIYLGGWLAMWLQLEQPATTMITVSIVMHPHSGMVLAKSFYRALGTLAGSLVGLGMMALFPQQRELFLLSLSLWVALCAGGAMLYRNFMAYGFVLAGYTAAIVALPAVSNPLNVFDSAVMRVSEVLLGIAVSALVSELVLPERLRPMLRRNARAHFGEFVAFVRGSTAGSIPREAMEDAQLASVRAAVQLEDLRASVIFEDPEIRLRSRRMRLLNQRYMAAATSFHSLHHLINRMQRGGSDAVVQALIALYRPLGVALTPAPGQPDDGLDSLAPQLLACAQALPARAAALRAGLADAAAATEFDTGAALLARFVDELHAFVATEVALRAGAAVHGSVERVHFSRGNDLAGAGLAVLRTFLTMAALSAFWLASGWAFGSSAMLLATIFSGLMGASPNPIGAVTRTLYGYAAGMIGAAVVVFGLLPGSDGFVMLVAATLPLLLIGPYLSTRDTLPGVGAGYTLGFVYILALKNPMVYDPEHFFNDAIAQLAGLALSGAAFMLLPGLAGWQRRLRQLRRLVWLAATAPLEGLSWRFESLGRDLLLQAVTHTRPGSAESRTLLAWSLAVQESGRAVIELRQDLAAGELPPAARATCGAAVQAVAQLYRWPGTARREAADRAVDAAIAVAPPAVRNHLYQLRSALRDDESPLAAAVRAAAPRENAHAP